MIPRILCALFSAGLAMAQSAAAPDPGAAGRKALDLLLAQKYPEMRQMFTAEVDKAFPDAGLQGLGAQVKSWGAPEKIGDPQVQRGPGGLSIVVVPVKFAAVEINFQVTIDGEGKIAGLFLRPGSSAPSTPWVHPQYSKPDSFRERDITIGDDEWKLPGTLTVPVGNGPFPAIVLVHGSGPNDRDESIGANKVFKDLAEGLASRGVVVLRYEKRTRQYPAKMAAMEKLTVREETVEDAVRAAAALRAQPEVDAKRVFVLGHSLGGNLAPRIAQADAKLAGLVLLAGSVRPLEDAVLEQSEYLGATPADLQTMRAQVAKVKALEPGDEDAPPVRVGPVSAPVSYWLDLKAYDPTAVAKKLTIPMLILQGERDYQVSMKDFELWKSAAGSRKNVTLRSYPALNHLFIAGEGKSLPTEYNKPGHVAPEVIDDIAKFVGK
jgi:dienelactone hydrolase